MDKFLFWDEEVTICEAVTSVSTCIIMYVMINVPSVTINVPFVTINVPFVTINVPFSLNKGHLTTWDAFLAPFFIMLNDPSVKMTP